MPAGKRIGLWGGYIQNYPEGCERIWILLFPSSLGGADAAVDHEVQHAMLIYNINEVLRHASRSTNTFFTVLCSLIPTPHCNCDNEHDTQSKANISHDRVDLPPTTHLRRNIFWNSHVRSLLSFGMMLDWKRKKRRHWKPGSRTFLLLFDIITDSWLFLRGTY